MFGTLRYGAALAEPTDALSHGAATTSVLLEHVAELGERVGELLEDLVAGDLAPAGRPPRDDLH